MCIKKGFVPVLFALWISFFLFSTQAWALESDGFEYNIKDGEATITKYIGNAGKDIDVNVPSVLSGCPVTVFGGGDEVFKWGTTLHHVILPDTVIKIGKSAFRSTNIEEITISNQLQVIEKNAFLKGAFKSIILPNTLKEIGEAAFDHADIANIVIPDSVTDIGNFVFYFSSITSCQMSAGVKKIPNGAFQHSKLENIVLKDGLESIGDAAFANCRKLKRVDVPLSVNSMGNHVFNECDSLEYVNIPYGVTRIGVRAFDGCRSLKELIIPHSVTKIDVYAFWGCRSLTSLIIPDSVTNISDEIIRDCDNLESVIVPSSVVEGKFFDGSGCPKMIVYVKSGSYAEQMAKKKSKLSVIVDDSVDQIASRNQETPIISSSEPVWKQDSFGWWLERPDGSYLANEWYQNPSNGLWYYMGPDGYMLTNTTTPDGYWVNSDGAMTQ